MQRVPEERQGIEEARTCPPGSASCRGHVCAWVVFVNRILPVEY